jgi:hypothetical protein
MANGPISGVKILKFFLIFLLGFVLYLTERSLRIPKVSDSDELPMARRSMLENPLDVSLESQPLFVKSSPQAESEIAVNENISKNVGNVENGSFFEVGEIGSTLPQYIIEVKPMAVTHKQSPKERRQFLSSLQRNNATRWQYPDHVRIPLAELAIVYYNGRKYLRQGEEFPPEYRENEELKADTRTRNTAELCKGSHGEQNKQEQEREKGSAGFDLELLGRSMMSKPQPIGCCNGIPYNSNKRCCCRRASFNKDEKFCCAVNGCASFRVFNRADDNYAACQSLDGKVVEEYGYWNDETKKRGFMDENHKA